MNNLESERSSMCSLKEQQSVTYTGIPDKITTSFKKYERLTLPLQPPSELLYPYREL